jgi:hypothetical protein
MACNDSKPVPEFDAQNTERFWPKVDKSGGPDACWPWMGNRSRGYGHFRFNPGRHTLSAHRVAYFLGHGENPGTLFVLHRCDVKICCNPAHLFLGTTTDNMRDAKAKGLLCSGDNHYSRIRPELVLRGTRHGMSKLTESLVAEIRALHATGSFKQIDLAAKFGISQSIVSHVLRRETWTHVL